MKTIAIAATVLLCVAGARADDGTAAVRKEIESQYTTQSKAMNDKDAKAFISIFTSDFQQIPPMGNPLGVAEVQTAARAKMQKEEIEETPAQIESIRVAGDRAIVVSKHTFTFPYKDASFKTQLKTHTAYNDELWVKTASGWRMKLRKEAVDTAAPPAGFGR